MSIGQDELKELVERLTRLTERDKIKTWEHSSPHLLQYATQDFTIELARTDDSYQLSVYSLDGVPEGTLHPGDGDHVQSLKDERDLGYLFDLALPKSRSTVSRRLMSQLLDDD